MLLELFPVRTCLLTANLSIFASGEVVFFPIGFSAAEPGVYPGGDEIGKPSLSTFHKLPRQVIVQRPTVLMGALPCHCSGPSSC